MADLARREPLAASPRALMLTKWARHIVTPPVRFYMARTRFKLITEGAKNFPAKGPCLVLSNHVSFFDPVQLIFSSGRNIHFMTTQATMTDPALATVMRLFGAVPKQKGVADPKAIRGLHAWAKVGAAVGLFPEGERSWDGRPLPLLPGIERLVRMLKLPVVCARIENADLVIPRWATHTRKGKVRVSFDAPRTFEKKADRALIRAWIQESLSVDPGNCWRGPVAGTKLARGLTNILFACPACGEVEGLVESDDEVNCRSCSKGWRLESNNTLHSVGDPASSPEALWELTAELDQRLASQIESKLAAESEAILMQSEEPVDAIRLGDEVQSLATGRLQLTSSRVAIVDSSGATQWEVPMDQAAAMTIELVRRCQIALKGGELIELRIPRESAIKFKRAFDHLSARTKTMKASKALRAGASRA